jgi:hypothetical protein
MDTFTRRVRAGLLAALVALVMLASALPASADNSKGHSGPRNVTWESNSAGITWE